MGTGLIIPGLRVVTNVESRIPLLDWGCGEDGPGNSPRVQTVPETDTGGLVENTEAFERTVLKELGKLPP